MKKKLFILGAGPRGLALALVATKYLDKLDVTIIDNEPINTWKPKNIVRDIQMRSPVTFDLVTYLEEFQHYSLSNFLNLAEMPFTGNQSILEKSNIYCDRPQFSKYLEYIFKDVKSKGVKHIRYNVTEIQEHCLNCSNNKTLNFDYLVIAGGRKFTKIISPYYLKAQQSKIVEMPTVINTYSKISTNKFLVYGSGQSAAEIVNFLASKKLQVFWSLKKEPRVTQYPVPDFSHWGVQSALGSYYRYIRAGKSEYLKKVKEWTPSITPFIDKHLKTNKKYITKIYPKSITEILNIVSEVNYIICATGEKPDISLVPFKFNIERYKFNLDYPSLKEGFQSVSHPYISFTGSLALPFDGPRQGSIISSGLSASEILMNIVSFI